MKEHVLSWLLGGALLASLSWNLRPREASPPPTPCPESGACTETCLPAGTDLALGPERMEDLRRTCQTFCERADDLDARARAAFSRLARDLAHGDLDDAQREERVRAIAELRAASVRVCIEGLREVRAVLGPEEYQALVASCGL